MAKGMCAVYSDWCCSFPNRHPIHPSICKHIQIFIASLVSQCVRHRFGNHFERKEPLLLFRIYKLRIYLLFGCSSLVAQRAHQLFNKNAAALPFMIQSLWVILVGDRHSSFFLLSSIHRRRHCRYRHHSRWLTSNETQSKFSVFEWLMMNNWMCGCLQTCKIWSKNSWKFFQSLSTAAAVAAVNSTYQSIELTSERNSMAHRQVRVWPNSTEKERETYIFFRFPLAR